MHLIYSLTNRRRTLFINDYPDFVNNKWNYKKEEAHRIKLMLCEQAGIALLIVAGHDWVHDNDKTKHTIGTVIDSLR